MDQKDIGVGSLFLNDTWSLYFHDADDNNWTMQSYRKLAQISTVEEFAIIAKTLTDLWDRGMFFIMRSHIDPIWEHEENRHGGCFSMKVMKNHVNNVWFQTCAQTLSECLVKNKENWSIVSGISISPKRSYCIIRVWINNIAYKDSQNFNLNNPDYTEIFFKPHTS